LGTLSGTNYFNVEYGTTDGNWLYNTNVTGFSTTIGNLSFKFSIWVRVAARNDCTIGNYGEPKLVGGPGLPNTGLAERNDNTILYISVGILIIILTSSVLILKRRRFLNNG